MTDSATHTQQRFLLGVDGACDAVGDACDNAPWDYNPGQNDTPSPKFDLEGEYPYTAQLEVPDLTD
jgi:hypothetical protein